MRFLLTLVVAFLLTGCGKVSSPVADELDAFLAAGFDAVTVYAIDSSRAPRPDDRSDEAYWESGSEVNATHFHAFPIRKQVEVTDAGMGKRLAEATARDMRSRATSYKCFEPHHGLRVRRGTAFFDLVICHTCGNLEAWSDIRRGTMHETSDGASGILEQALKANQP